MGATAQILPRAVIGQKRPSAEALVQSFNSWAFRREQPDDPERLQGLAAMAVKNETPLAFVLSWGRGPRVDVAAPERQCPDFLAGLARRMQSIHAPGADLTLICTDTYAELNGCSRLSTRRYFAQVGREAWSRPYWWCSSAGASRSRSALSIAP